MFKSIFLPLIAVAAFIVFVGLLSQGKLDFIFKKTSPTIQNQEKVSIGNIEIKLKLPKQTRKDLKAFQIVHNLIMNLVWFLFLRKTVSLYFG